MRNKFDQELENLNNTMISMCALCENAIAGAVKALLKNDISLAEKTVERAREIDRKEKDIESLCLRLLLQQQPVARDLRTISSALKMITDMERIGDQAADIAEIVRHSWIGGETENSDITDMALAVIKMVTDSIDAFVKGDLQLAQSVIQYDDMVDDLFVRVRKGIASMISTDGNCGDSAVDLLMIAKYLERIGDHATNIAGWVVFSITGQHTYGER